MFDPFFGITLLDAAYIMHAVIFSASVQLLAVSLWVNWKVNK